MTARSSTGSAASRTTCASSATRRCSTSGSWGFAGFTGSTLAELGARAYRAAGEALELLAEDRGCASSSGRTSCSMLRRSRTRSSFCANAPTGSRCYADILRHRRRRRRRRSDSDRGDLATRAPLMAAVRRRGRGDALPVLDVRRLERPRRNPTGPLLTRHELLAAYERMVLFAALDVDRLRAALRRDRRRPARRGRGPDATSSGSSPSGRATSRKPPASSSSGRPGSGRTTSSRASPRLSRGVLADRGPAC